MLHKSNWLFCVRAAVQLKTTLSFASAELDRVVVIVSAFFRRYRQVCTFPFKAIVACSHGKSPKEPEQHFISHF